MVPFNLALVVTSLVVISIHVFMRRRSRLFCFLKDASAVKIAGVVLHRVLFSAFFVLNRVRVSDPQRHSTPIPKYWSSTQPPGTFMNMTS